MSAAADDSLRHLPVSRLPRARAGRTTEWSFPAAVAVVILVMLFAIAARHRSEQRSLRALPQEQRAALVSHTVDELRRHCGDARIDALKDHCHELAAFAAQFDECKGECEALVRRQLAPTPTR